MVDPELISLTTKIALLESCDPILVCAVIEQESSWNQWAIRYEPLFMTKYVGPLYASGKITSATEAYARSISWGLMQLMGQSIREIGYSGPLPQLCEPSTGILWGCRLLRKKLDKTSGDVTKGLLLWNGGANAAYPVQVLARQVRYQSTPVV